MNTSLSFINFVIMSIIMFYFDIFQQNELTRRNSYDSIIIKVLPFSKRFTLVYVTYQESNSSVVGAVAFLMFMYPIRLDGIDCRDDDTDYRHDDTNNLYCRFYHHILYLS